MDKILPLARQLSQARWLPLLMILMSLGILGSTIHFGSRLLRDSIREQILSRDAELLDAVARLEQLGSDSPVAFGRQLEDPAGQMALVLKLSRLRDGVLATRLFDASGEMVVSVPVQVRSVRLTSTELDRLRRLVPLARYEPQAQLADYFLSPAALAADRLPVLSVLVPLHAEGGTNLLATAEFIQDGANLQRELARLDRNLRRQALVAFGASGTLLTVALTWAFLRLRSLTRRLQDHAASLRHANQELALSAKTSALGAVTAHVIHGLSSPLNSLQNFLSAHEGEHDEWKDAAASTRRMQSLVGEVVRVLGEQNGGAEYELPLTELAQVLERRLRPLAATKGVELTVEVHHEGALSNHRANLVLFIVENLVQNAVQATPSGKSVSVFAGPCSAGILFEVADQGPGLPDSGHDRLFVPCCSSKPGGNGIGLALSQQLARHLGATLKLVHNSSEGARFALILPEGLLETSTQTEVAENCT
jgi:signal transduction histidine kinase